MMTSDEPFHVWCGLSYLNYLVIPRTLAQSMPVEWQAQLVALLEEAEPLLKVVEPAGGYRVQALDSQGRFARDPYADYERGRRRLEIPSE